MYGNRNGIFLLSFCEEWWECRADSFGKLHQPSDTDLIQCQNGVVEGGFRSQSTIQQAVLMEYTCHIKYTLALGYFG